VGSEVKDEDTTRFLSVRHVPTPVGRRPKWAIRDRDEAATGLAMSLLHPKGEIKSRIGIYRDETQRIDRVGDA
jgi:hypothetical protein